MAPLKFVNILLLLLVIIMIIVFIIVIIIIIIIIMKSFIWLMRAQCFSFKNCNICHCTVTKMVWQGLILFI